MVPEETERLKERAYIKWLMSNDVEGRKYYSQHSVEVKKAVNYMKNKLWSSVCNQIDQYVGRSRSNKAWEN